jgi:tetratricopeptide (TPR) repeat protein
VEYFARLLELTPINDPARSALALQLADAHYLMGDFPAARAAIEKTQTAAQTDSDRASALALLGEMTIAMGDYVEAGTILAQAAPLARASGDKLTLCRALWTLGMNEWRLGKPDEARAAQEESLALARELGDVTRELFALNLLGILFLQTDLAEAERFFTEVHTLAVTAGNRERAMTALYNLSVAAGRRKDYAASQEYDQQALALAREIGSQETVAAGLIVLAGVEEILGNLLAARAHYREALALASRLADNCSLGSEWFCRPRLRGRANGAGLSTIWLGTPASCLGQ